MKVKISHFTRLFIPPNVTIKVPSDGGGGGLYLDPDDLPEWYKAEMCF